MPARGPSGIRRSRGFLREDGARKILPDAAKDRPRNEPSPRPSPKDGGERPSRRPLNKKEKTEERKPILDIDQNRVSISKAFGPSGEQLGKEEMLANKKHFTFDAAQSGGADNAWFLAAGYRGDATSWKFRGRTTKADDDRDEGCGLGIAEAAAARPPGVAAPPWLGTWIVRRRSRCRRGREVGSSGGDRAAATGTRIGGGGALTAERNRYDESSTQKQFYEESCYPLVEAVMEGFNGTIFAYGQTGCGKTWTMQGPPSPKELRGVIPSSFDHIFEHIACTKNVEFLVRCSSARPRGYISVGGGRCPQDVGDGSRRRRGRDADIPWRRVATPPRRG